MDQSTEKNPLEGVQIEIKEVRRKVLCDLCQINSGRQLLIRKDKDSILFLCKEHFEEFNNYLEETRK